LPPRKENVLDILRKNQVKVMPVGKIYDIFAGKSLENPIRTASNREGLEKTLALLEEDFHGFCFVNLVDTDMLYGHRNDVDGYAAALSEIDSYLPRLAEKLREDDLLILTADHGCDPATPSTDHSREYIPLLCFGKRIKPVNLGTRLGFGHIGATVLEALGVKGKVAGTSFLRDILR
jgi:phosphopentomutase